MKITLQAPAHPNKETRDAGPIGEETGFLRFSEANLAAHFNLHLCTSGRVGTTPSGTISNAVLLPIEYGKFVPRGRGTNTNFYFGDQNRSCGKWSVRCMGLIALIKKRRRRSAK